MGKLWMFRLVCVLIVVCLPGSNLNAAAQASPRPDNPKSVSTLQHSEDNQPALPNGFQILTSTNSGLILDLQAPSYVLQESQVDGLACQTLKAEGYFDDSSPGEPGLLSAGVMIGIPGGAPPSIAIQSLETVDVPGPVHLCPKASPVLQRNAIGLDKYQGDVFVENSTAYQQDAFLPSEPVELTSSGAIRSQHVARLRFVPFQYNPAQNKLRVIQHVKVEVKLGVGISFHPAIAPKDEAPFETELQKMLINYEQARAWRDSPQAQTLSLLVSSPPSQLNLPHYKIQVDQDGLYQVTYTALQSAGVPVDGLDPWTFRILNQGTEIPIIVNGEADGKFDPGDSILFYGQQVKTPYTNTNVYWLSWGNGDGLRMATLNASVTGSASYSESFITTLHLEQDLTYFNESASGPHNDHWYWYFLNSYSGPVSHDFPFQVQNLAAGSTTVRVRGLLKGYYALPQHHTMISLNGHLIDDQTWPSTSDYPFSVDIPASSLVTGTNTLTVTCPRDNGISIDDVLVNWFEIDYDHTYTAEINQLAFGGDQVGLWDFQVGGFSSSSIDVLDITNPMAPLRLLGGSIQLTGPLFQINLEQQVTGPRHFLAVETSRRLTPSAILQDVPSNLKDPDNQADYIIISHHDFLTAIQPLADYRASQGFHVKVVDVQDVYDEFNGGVFDPQAIHSFLAYAYSSWTGPAPAYVLLVGDGHYDPKNNLGTSGPVYIPPYLGEFDPWIGETASDNRFVTVSGNDNLPDMFIGRLPANSAAETTAMVNKIVSYEHSPTPSEWNIRLTLVADDADSAGNFPALSDQIADQYLPPAYTTEKIYYGSAPNTTVAGTQAAIINAINQGRLIVQFTGHASSGYWAAEKLFGTNSISSLTNAEKYPFMVPMTCQEGYFIFPNFASLGESVVRAGGKGAIASWSPTGFGLSSGHTILLEGLYQAIFNNNMIQIGPATDYGKYYLYTNGLSSLDLIDTYVLFGDPATRLKTNPTVETMDSYSGKPQQGGIQLVWQTANEVWLNGFNLYRSQNLDGPKQQLNSTLISAKKPGQAAGNGYQYFDPVDGGKDYFYWIEIAQVNGTTMVGPVFVTSQYWENFPLVFK